MLRYSLPLSLEHMLTFIHTIHTMVCEFYEKIPVFEEEHPRIRSL